MNGIHTPGIGEGGTVEGLQIGGHQSGLPVVALDHVGKEADRGQSVQTGAGEKGEALAVIQVAVDGTGSGAKIVFAVQKVDLNAVGAVHQLHNTAVLAAPAQGNGEGGDGLYFVGGVLLDLLVIGKDQNHLVARDPGQRGGESLHHVAQSPGLGVGCAL